MYVLYVCMYTVIDWDRPYLWAAHNTKTVVYSSVAGHEYGSTYSSSSSISLYCSLLKNNLQCSIAYSEVQSVHT